ncbi:T9SS type A sorting domain-containing protein [Croceimicrobium sp.]|uniref:T9SS type A sorting domain-containing protein n=1 Tax=Croceimicrobium sp. TaxID=2828340 RepID=UPI003BA90C63
MNKLKILIGIWLLGLSALLAQNGPTPCGSSINYAPDPDYPGYTPTKRLRLVLHIIQEANGKSNFTAVDMADQSGHPQSAYWQNLINSLNRVHANLAEESRQDPDHPTPHMLDSRIRFSLSPQNVVYDRDPEFHKHFTDSKEDRLNSLYKRFVTDNPNLNFKENALHVFAFPHHSPNDDHWGSFNSNRLILNGSYQDFLANGISAWATMTGALNHEIAHCIGLLSPNRDANYNCDPFQDDFCDDTPSSQALNPCPCNSSPAADGLPCSNNMMASNARKDALTRCQIGRLHYALTHNNARHYVDFSDFCNYHDRPLSLAGGSNEVWENPRYLIGDLILEPGASLTLKCYLSLPEKAVIKVMPGAKLIIDGGQVGNICGKYFDGVYVFGDSHRSQSPANQGMVILKNNAIIENAVVGLSFIGIKGNYQNRTLVWSQTGGYVLAENSSFRNNLKDVEFMSYHPKNSLGKEVNNRSYFENCNFLTTDEAPLSASQFKDHISMWDVNGIRFSGCSFREERSAMPASESRTGIKSIRSSFQIDHRCINPSNCINFDRSEFLGLKQAVEARRNGSKGLIKIEHTQISCYKGIYLFGTFESLVRANIFEIEHIPILASNFTEYPYGLYLDACDQFNTEGNQFNGHGNAMAEGAAGLVIRNAGEADNEFYRSQFQDLHLGSQAIGINRHSQYLKGLRFRCNSYLNGFTDLDIREAPMSISPLFGIARNQGFRSPPVLLPNNEFSNFSSILNFNIDNEGAQIDYVFDGPANRTNLKYPYSISPRVRRLAKAGPSVCSNRISTYGSDGTQLEIDLMNAKPLLIQGLNQMQLLTDGGNTDYFLQLIESAVPGNALQVYNDLQSASPFLSNWVLAQLAASEYPFSQEQIRDLLMANPHSARNPTLIQSLRNRSDNFPEAYILDIAGTGEQYSLRDSLMEDLARVELEYTKILNEYIAGRMLDSNNSTEALHSYLKHPSQASFHYHLADRYFADKNFVKFNQVKDSIALVFPLRGRDLEYHQSYEQLYSMLYNWFLQDSVLFKAEDHITELQNFATSHNQLPDEYFALLAMLDQFPLLHDVYMPESGLSAKHNLSSDSNLIKVEDNTLSLYPNPANEKIELAWTGKGQPSNVQVFESSGRILYHREWSGKEPLLINISKWPSGTYWIQVQDERHGTLHRSLIVSH